MAKLSSLMISLLLFGMMVAGPIFYFSSLVNNVESQYGVTITQSNTTTFQVANQIIEKSKELQDETRSMTTGNPFTDFVNMLVRGAQVLTMMWDLTGIFTNIINDFVSFLGIAGEGGWITAGIMGIILIIITTKILSILLNREV